MWICSVIFPDHVQGASHGLAVWRENSNNDRGPQK